jgi:hypothetical protein
MTDHEFSAVDNYLRDFLQLMCARAREAREEASVAASVEDSAFAKGRALAYYEVVSTAIGQLHAFGLFPERFGFSADFDPDEQLL